MPDNVISTARLIFLAADDILEPVVGIAGGLVNHDPGWLPYGGVIDFICIDTIAFRMVQSFMFTWSFLLENNKLSNKIQIRKIPINADEKLAH
jgi:hypothetical protein